MTNSESLTYAVLWIIMNQVVDYHIHHSEPEAGLSVIHPGINEFDLD